MNPAEVEAELKEQLKRQPDSFEANHYLGELLIQRGDLAAAIPYLERAFQIDPIHEVNGHDLVLAHLHVGNAEVARDYVERLLKQKESARLHNLMGAAQEQLGDPVAAAKEYQRAAEMDPSESNVFDFANCLLHYSAVEAAEQVFQFGIQKYPDSAKLRVGYGVAQYVSGEYDKAVETLCDAVDLDPRDTRALYFLGKLHDLNPEIAGEVSQRLARFVSLYPDNAAANYYYAVSLWKVSKESPDKIREVEKLLKKALSLDQGMSEAHLQLGLVYEKAGWFDEAITEFDTTIRLDPEAEAAYYHLAQSLMRTGHGEEAHQYLQKFRELREQSQAKESKTEKERMGLVVH